MGAMGLSVKQPYAWAIASGAKAIENRTWTTRYRGTLLIHASVGRDFHEQLGESPLLFFAQYGVAYPSGDELCFGAIVATATLADVVPLEQAQREHASPWVVGPWCWVLRDVRRLSEPVACRGFASLWNPPPDVLKAVARQIGF